MFFIVSLKLSAQQKDDITITAGQDFDIRKTSFEYFGTPDLWTYILKYNNIDNLGEITPGSKINIPQKKVKNLLSKLNDANSSIQNAVQAGVTIWLP